MILLFIILQLAATFTFATNSSQSSAKPYSPSAPYIDKFDKSPVTELENMQAKNLSGWDKEKPAVRALYLEQAQQYRRYRAMGRAGVKSEFAEKCLQDPKSNVFCRIEAARVLQRASLAENKTSQSQKQELAQLIRKQDLSALKGVDHQKLIRALGTFADFKGLEELSEKASADRKCELPQLALALGSKAEEFFPDEKLIALATKLYTRAYECSKDNNVAVQARFRAALLSLWRNDCSEVEGILAPLTSLAEGENYWARARYWRHYCASQRKDTDIAKKMSEELWQNHPMSLQNLLVNGEDARLTVMLSEKEKPKVLYRSILNPELNDYALAIEALMDLRAPDLVSDVVSALSSEIATGEAGFRLYIAALTSRMESALPRFKVLALLFRDQPAMLTGGTLRMYFPLAHFDAIDTAQNPVDPFLVLSLVRQESAFNTRAMSGAGARGLMQMMPATARQMGAPSKNSLFNPVTNLRFGTKYLAKQLRNFEGDVELTLAAYNAGFARVASWLKRYPVSNRILFMDLMPYRETRDYVTSIVRNYYWYVQLYSKESLKARLTTTHKPPRVPIRMLSLDDNTTTAVKAE